MTDAELLAEIEDITEGEARGRGALQGASLMFGDEASGGLAALASTAQTPWRRTPGPKALALLYPGVPYADAAQRWFSENRPDVAAADAAEKGRQAAPGAYVSERDRQRTMNEAARTAHPGDYLIGEVGAAAPLMAATGGAGLVGSGGIAALQGLGSSNADSPGGLAGDTALGLGLGLGGHALGALAGKAAQGVKGTAGRALGRALAKQTATEAAAKATAVQSAAGSVGKWTSEQNRVVEAIRGLLTERNLTPAQAQKLAGYQGTPEYAAAVDGLVESLGDRLSDYGSRLAVAKTGLAAAQGGKPVAQMAQEGVSPKAAWERAIRPRLLRYGPVAAGLMAGAAVDQPWLGALAGAGTRPMVRSLIRGAKDPAMQTMLWKPIAAAGKVGASQPGRALTMSLARAGAASSAPAASDEGRRLLDYLGKSKDERSADDELRRLLE